MTQRRFYAALEKLVDYGARHALTHVLAEAMELHRWAAWAGYVHRVRFPRTALLLDDHIRMRAVSPYKCELCGQPEDDLLGKRLTSFCDCRVVHRRAATVAEVIQTKKTTHLVTVSLHGDTACYVRVMPIPRLPGALHLARPVYVEQPERTWRFEPLLPQVIGAPA